MEWVYDDGGRKEAGYKGTTGDCVCRAIAIAMERPYKEVYEDLNAFLKDGRQTKKRKDSGSRTGIHRQFIQKYMEFYGWEWIPCMQIGSGCQVHLKPGELPGGRIIVSLTKHLAAVIDGVLHDISDCSRNETRCVYGYWTKE